MKAEFFSCLSFSKSATLDKNTIHHETSDTTTRVGKTALLYILVAYGRHLINALISDSFNLHGW